MEKGHTPDGVLTPAGRRDMLREGQAVLRALGRTTLAREFLLRASSLPTREEVADLLLEYLPRRHRD